MLFIFIFFKSSTVIHLQRHITNSLGFACLQSDHKKKRCKTSRMLCLPSKRSQEKAMQGIPYALPAFKVIIRQSDVRHFLPSKNDARINLKVEGIIVCFFLFFHSKYLSSVGNMIFYVLRIENVSGSYALHG